MLFLLRLLRQITAGAGLTLAAGCALAQSASPPAAPAAATPSTPTSASRGQLLYDTHCIECHTQQMHWRTLNQARDWDSLRMQVQRWQGVARLNWSEADITEVARHLNESIYKFPRPTQTSGVR